MVTRGVRIFGTAGYRYGLPIFDRFQEIELVELIKNSIGFDLIRVRVREIPGFEKYRIT